MRNSFGGNTPATRGFHDQTTRPFGSGGAELNLVNEGAVGVLILYICWERQAVGVVPVYCLKAWAKAAC